MKFQIIRMILELKQWERTEVQNTGMSTFRVSKKIQ